MKNFSIPFVTLLLLIASASVLYSQSKPQKKSNIIAKGAVLNKISSDFLFTEGPAADADGNVFFTDQPNDKIMKWSTDGTVSVYMEGAGRSNGLYFDNNGNLLSCADLHNQLLSIDRDKKVTVLVKDVGGKKLNGPNDLWVDPGGGVYFTDPFYKRDYWTRTEKEIEQENVYYLSPDRKTIVIVATDFVRPNGIVGTAEGRKLYVADIGDKKTYAFNINSDGTLSDRKLFAAMGSDGMTVDSKGNVYLTGKGVTVLNAEGSEIEQIAVDEPWTANVCFGGKDKKTLFITASKSVYSLRMNVMGAR
ncbi:MAG: SMP-30/gluconolactonase/LRE family protein [Cyclobacteriaceae bacterium]|jgi:gluconolactonase|nr:SMP-30/gluconolactonase/LRE family protein [Cyclobacteriaceae bacterium]MDH5251448.1 SMP-30/gluconolactonase/LRE family protein [Cyclobacteriaceae bacterium]